MAQRLRSGPAVARHDVARAGEQVLVGHQSVEPDRTARVELAGRDPDLGSEAVAGAVGEARRDVAVDARGVDLRSEALPGRGTEKNVALQLEFRPLGSANQGDDHVDGESIWR